MREDLISVKKIDTLKEFRSLEKDWNGLLEKSAINEPYLSFEWQFSWWKSFGQGKELFIIVVKLHKEFIGIAPLMITKKLKLNTIQFIGTGWSDYLNFIIRKDDRDALGAIINYISSKNNWDVIFLSDVLYYNNYGKDLTESVKINKLKLTERKYYNCPYLPINVNYETYLKNQSRKFRKSLKDTKKAIQKLEKKGDVKVITVGNKLKYDNIVNIMSDIEERSWKKKEHSQHFRAEKIKEFFHELITKFMGNNWVKVWLFNYNNLPIAYLMTFYYNKKVYSYLTAYDNRYKNVGAYLLNHMIEETFRSQFKGLELLRGESKTKSRLTSNFKQNHQIIIYKNSIKSIVLKIGYKIRWKASENKIWRRFYFKGIKLKRQLRKYYKRK